MFFSLSVSSLLTLKRLDKHRHSPSRRFPLIKNPIMLADLYPRARRLVISDEALQFALSYNIAASNKRPLHHIAVDKSNELGRDLLSQRQKALEWLVPKDISTVELWEWDYDRQGNLVNFPSRVHLEWLCWGYTPDERGVLECGHRELSDRLSVVL
jgi:hypothetical protein